MLLAAFIAIPAMWAAAAMLAGFIGVGLGLGEGFGREGTEGADLEGAVGAGRDGTEGGGGGAFLVEPLERDRPGDGGPLILLYV